MKLTADHLWCHNCRINLEPDETGDYNCPDCKIVTLSKEVIKTIEKGFELI